MANPVLGVSSREIQRRDAETIVEDVEESQLGPKGREALSELVRAFAARIALTESGHLASSLKRSNGKVT
ncbi:hypothetical protein ABK046_52250, partial [Streptomyces caeruleatus]